MRFLRWIPAASLTAAALLVAAPIPRLTAQSIEPSDLARLVSQGHAFAEAAARKLNYLPGEVVVRFKTGAPEARQRALSALRSRPSLNDVTWVGDTAVLRDPLEPDSLRLARQLSEQPEVAWAEPNYIYKLPVIKSGVSRPMEIDVPRPFVTPNDPGFSSLQWNFSAQGIDMPRAWDINNGGSGDLIVAIVDTGLTNVNQTIGLPTFDGIVIRNFAIPFATSPELVTSRFVTPRDFTFFAPAIPVGSLVDMVGHGTHVASTIAQSTNNGTSLAGMAFNVRLMPLKACVGFWEVQIAQSLAGIPGFVPLDSGGCSNTAIANAITFAANSGAKVINISLGGAGASNLVRTAITTAVSRGAVVSIAMGNEFEDGNPTQFPAADAATIDGALSVAAVGRSLARAFYSSTGAHCEIAAPGGDSRQGGQFGEIWQTTLRQADVSELLIVPRFDRYEDTPFQGTSMATPHVSGLAALIMSQSPTITPAAVESLITRTARDLGAAGKDNNFGFGLIQPRKALFGFGIVR
jgi:serine protease